MLVLASFTVQAQVQFSYMGQYNNMGVPDNLEDSSDAIGQLFLNDINAALPDMKPVPSFHPEYIAQNNETDVVLKAHADIWITFVSEGGDYTNALGYYTYNASNPPKSASEIKTRWIIFPNVSLVGSGGGLKSGNKIYLGSFEAGTALGWFVVADAFKNGKVTQGKYIVYSEPALNPEKDPKLKAHTVLLKDAQRGKLVLSFEDMLRDQGSDQDFNDLTFYITANPYSAINTDALVSIDGSVPTTTPTTTTTVPATTPTTTTTTTPTTTATTPTTTTTDGTTTPSGNTNSSAGNTTNNSTSNNTTNNTTNNNPNININNNVNNNTNSGGSNVTTTTNNVNTGSSTNSNNSTTNNTTNTNSNSNNTTTVINNTTVINKTGGGNGYHGGGYNNNNTNNNTNTNVNNNHNGNYGGGNNNGYNNGSYNNGNGNKNNNNNGGNGNGNGNYNNSNSVNSSVTVCNRDGFQLSNFNTLLATIKAQTVESNKSMVIKQAVQNKRLTVSQVKEIIKQIVVEQYKLDMAEYLFDFTCDKSNYYELNALLLPSRARELDEYLQGKDRSDDNVTSVNTSVNNSNTGSTQNSTYVENNTYNSTSNGNILCNNGRMPDDELDDLKSSINSKPFSDSKISILKEAMPSRCINSIQVKDIMSLFSFESDKLTVAKYLYRYTSDKANYYKVNDAFSFSSSIDELKGYIKNAK
jgi:hypothetical protein